MFRFCCSKNVKYPSQTPFENLVSDSWCCLKSYGKFRRCGLTGRHVTLGYRSPSFLPVLPTLGWGGPVPSFCTTGLPDSRFSLPWWTIPTGQNKPFICFLSVKKNTQYRKWHQKWSRHSNSLTMCFKCLWNRFVEGLQKSLVLGAEEPLNVTSRAQQIILVGSWEIRMLTEMWTVNTSHRFQKGTGLYQELSQKPLTF